MSKRHIRIISIAVLTVVSLLYGWMARNEPEGRKADEKRSIFVGKVIDGDTVQAVVNGNNEHIRLIGIDAPELGQRPWGKKSKTYLNELVSASGWQVGIEYDVEHRDKYNRVLAYLWSRDGRMVNEEMVRNGYAVLYTFPPNVKYVDRIKAAQVVARENRLGIWSKGGLRQTPSDYRKEHPRR